MTHHQLNNSSRGSQTLVFVFLSYSDQYIASVKFSQFRFNGPPLPTTNHPLLTPVLWSTWIPDRVAASSCEKLDEFSNFLVTAVRRPLIQYTCKQRKDQRILPLACMRVPVSHANFQYAEALGLPRGTIALFSSCQLGSFVVTMHGVNKIGLEKMPVAFVLKIVL